MSSNNHYHEDMLSVEEAKEAILKEFSVLNTENISLLNCMEMILAEDITSTINIPPLNNSAMDGYAVLTEDLKDSELNHVELDIIDSVSAGEIPQKKITSGKTIRIMTGAPIPDGANAVVPFEDTDELERREKGKDINKILIKSKISHFENIRKKGEDIFKGSDVLSKGTLIKPAHIGVAASLGLAHLPVIRRPIVSIISTGNELQQPGTKLPKGKIYNSNAYSIASLVQLYGGIPKIIGISRDELDELKNILLLAMKGSDLVVTSAGVSKGDYDVVKDALKDMGKMSLWSVRMRPAKPLAFGTLEFKSNKVPHLGLPGNPVSAMVAFIQFGRPAMQIMMGRELSPIPTIKAILDNEIQNFDKRRVYSRVFVYKDNNNLYHAKTTGNQSSGVLTSMSMANGLAICPEYTDRIDKGEVVNVEMFDWPEVIL